MKCAPDTRIATAPGDEGGVTAPECTCADDAARRAADNMVSVADAAALGWFPPHWAAGAAAPAESAPMAFDTAGVALAYLREVEGVEPMARAVVADDPSRALRLTLYAEDGRGAAVPLSPIRALGIAAKLIEAATRRLAAE